MKTGNFPISLISFVGLFLVVAGVVVYDWVMQRDELCPVIKLMINAALVSYLVI